MAKEIISAAPESYLSSKINFSWHEKHLCGQIKLKMAGEIIPLAPENFLSPKITFSWHEKNFCRKNKIKMAEEIILLAREMFFSTAFTTQVHGTTRATTSKSAKSPWCLGLRSPPRVRIVVASIPFVI
jgi:hypothetical protein